MNGPTEIKTRGRPILTALLILALLPIGAVAIHRIVPPPTTLLMVKQAVGGAGLTYRWRGLNDISPRLVEAVIAAEDARFCEHRGFDFKAIEKALDSNARGRKMRGGSTISQQTAKNAFLWQGGGYFRKGLEAWFTVLIEAIWGKKRIMEVYLNVAETGIGTYGANAGAMRYFRHDASKLTPEEAARIAAVLPLPKKREAIDPSGFTRRHGNRLARWIGVVRRDGLDSCLK